MLKLKAFFLHILWNQSTAFIRMNLNEADAIKQILLWNCFQMILWSCWFHKFFREIYFKWFSKFVSISRIFLEIFLQNGFQVRKGWNLAIFFVNWFHMILWDYVNFTNFSQKSTRKMIFNNFQCNFANFFCGIDLKLFYKVASISRMFQKKSIHKINYKMQIIVSFHFSAM